MRAFLTVRPAGTKYNVQPTSLFQLIFTMEENKTVAAAEETPVVVEETKKAPLNASVDPDKFDWDAFESDDVYGEDIKDIDAKYSQTLSKVVEGEVVEGVVTAISKREVIVNIGYKSEGVIMAPEFRYNPELKVGDKVEVFVESTEDKKGQLILSHKKARQLRSWDMVNAAFAADEIVKGYVKTRTKGGMIVDVFGIEAFLPGSQIDIKPIRDYDQFVDTTMDFKIVKINQEFRNVVVSHKALIEAELEQQKSEIIGKLEKGQVLEGTVKNITGYGVFVDLGGVDGLIHITDLSWGRINHPEEVVSLDQKINVVILDFDESKKRIALGLKQLTVHPWDALDANLKLATRLRVKLFSSLTTVHSLRLSQVLRVLSMFQRCHGLQDSASHLTSSRLVTRLRLRSLLSTERRRRCLSVSNSSFLTHGRTSARNIL